MTEPRIRTVATTIHGRFLTEQIGAGSPRLLLVGFHGYAQNAQAILDPMRRFAPADSLLVAVQALHRFYSRSQQQVVASWMTREDRELMLADNLEYVDRVLAAARAECEAAGAGIVMVGFSQGTAMAWRAAVAQSTPVIALGGDIPPELTAQSLASVSSALVGHPSLDDWYTAEKHESDLARLADAGCSARSCRLDGGHDWSEQFYEACQEFVTRLTRREQD